jgi:hypothetical protein
MKWTMEKPTKPGVYWIYTVPVWEKEPIVTVVELYLTGDQIIFDIPCDGYEFEITITPERTTHWMGPIEPPEAPGDKK